MDVACGVCKTFEASARCRIRRQRCPTGCPSQQQSDRQTPNTRNMIPQIFWGRTIWAAAPVHDHAPCPKFSTPCRPRHIAHGNYSLPQSVLPHRESAGSREREGWYVFFSNRNRGKRSLCVTVCPNTPATTEQSTDVATKPSDRYPWQRRATGGGRRPGNISLSTELSSTRTQL